MNQTYVEINNLLDDVVLFSFDDVSERTKNIPKIMELFSLGKINVVIEQTFYLEHFDSASDMHEEANNFIEQGKENDSSVIYLPHIDIEAQAIHVVGYQYL